MFMSLKPKHFDKIYRNFESAISQTYDCGRMCAPLNDGQPVCCTADNAIPVVEKSEWKLLKGRTDLWKKYKPVDAASRKIVEELADSTCAVECKGAAFCERENRTLACRAFPFYPYFNKEKEIVGLAYYWIFEDRCWVLSNLQIVEQTYIDEILTAYKAVFKKDKDDRQAMVEQSASMRRVFSRQGRIIPIIAPDGSFKKVMPKSGGEIQDATIEDFAPHKNFSSDKNYRKAIKEWGGKAKGKTLSPDWSIKDWWNHK
jgi:hypothetical protein